MASTTSAKTTPRSVALVLLAAGKGKRMKSEVPKVLHRLAGRPALWYVTQAGLAARPTRVAFVTSYRAEDVEAEVEAWNLRPETRFVDQGTPLGTAHAVAAAEEATAGATDVLVMAGDDPLIGPEHVRDLLKVHRRTRAAATILTTFVDDPWGYGRVVRDGTELRGIIEESDATPEERAINEISTLVYVFRRDDLYRALPLVGRENRQREYYLPDVLDVLRGKGETISAVPADLGGGLGVNSRRGLAQATAILRRRIVERHMDGGVTFVDPDTAYVDVDVRIGRDTTVLPFTVLEGSTRIGSECVIGPGSRVVDSTVGDGAEVSYSVVRGSKIGRRVSIGPYASLRPGTVIDDDAKAGTFVELKSTRLGRGAKVPHLSYMGDATIGAGANVGAGSITCNYDGVNKHATTIGEGAFIGSDTMLVAPVKVGKRAWTGAGSTITRDVPAGALAVERSEQRVVRGYDERKRPVAVKKKARRRTGPEEGGGDRG